jgi:hypothetical protein
MEAYVNTVRLLAAFIAVFNLSVVVYELTHGAGFDLTRFNLVCWALVCFIGFGRRLY